jgi:hypothetical protein
MADKLTDAEIAEELLKFGEQIKKGVILILKEVDKATLPENMQII